MTATYAWLTPAAPAAIALLRLPPLPALSDRPLPAPGRLRLAQLVDAAGTAVDEVVFSRPSSEYLDCACHGGAGVRAAVSAALASHGLEAVAPSCPPAWARLAAAASPAAVLWLLASPEAEPPFDPRWLTELPLVLITGPPNAGKSTLLNAWCGHRRSLVSELPGTTRDLVAADVECAGWRLRLVDSAGLRAMPGDVLEAAGMRLVEAARAQAAVVLWLQPPAAPPAAVANNLLVHSKADLLPTEPAGEGLAWAAPAFVGELAAGAMLQRLQAAVLERLALPPLVLPAGGAS